jgi:hypothetical protein
MQGFVQAQSFEAGNVPITAAETVDGEFYADKASHLFNRALCIR